MTHELKIAPVYFREVLMESKRFEVRKNDRDFKEGDTICLKEFDGTKYTGSEIIVKVGFVLADFEGLRPGYCVFSIQVQTALL